MVGPCPPVDPDRTKSRCASAGNVGDGIVSDHPAPSVENHATSPGSDLEQSAVWLANALDARERVGVDGLGQSSLLELPELVVCRAVGDDGHLPAGRAESRQSIHYLRPTADKVRHAVA